MSKGKVTCECGAEISPQGMRWHLRSKDHACRLECKAAKAGGYVKADVVWYTEAYFDESNSLRSRRRTVSLSDIEYRKDKVKSFKTKEVNYYKGGWKNYYYDYELYVKKDYVDTLKAKFEEFAAKKEKEYLEVKNRGMLVRKERRKKKDIIRRKFDAVKKGSGKSALRFINVDKYTLEEVKSMHVRKWRSILGLDIYYLTNTKQKKHIVLFIDDKQYNVVFRKLTLQDLFGERVGEALEDGREVKRQGDVYFIKETPPRKLELKRETTIWSSHRVEEMKRATTWEIFARGRVTHPEHPELNLKTWHRVVVLGVD